MSDSSYNADNIKYLNARVEALEKKVSELSSSREEESDGTKIYHDLNEPFNAFVAKVLVQPLKPLKKY